MSGHQAFSATLYHRSTALPRARDLGRISEHPLDGGPICVAEFPVDHKRTASTESRGQATCHSSSPRRPRSLSIRPISRSTKLSLLANDMNGTFRYHTRCTASAALRSDRRNRSRSRFAVLDAGWGGYRENRGFHGARLLICAHPPRYCQLRREPLQGARLVQRTGSARTRPLVGPGDEIGATE